MREFASQYAKMKEYQSSGNYWDGLMLARQLCYALSVVIRLVPEMGSEALVASCMGSFGGRITVKGLQNMRERLVADCDIMTEKLKPQIDALSRSSVDSPDESESDIKAACDTLVNFGPGTEECELWFDRIAGLNDAKQMLKVGFIQPIVYPNLFGKLAKGMLLYGLPGTGKTLLIKAAVNELSKANPCIRVLFFAPQGANLKGKYVGETETKILSIYRGASALARRSSRADAENGSITISIVFIDEIDSIAASGRGEEGAMAQIAATSVNTLLQVMDGFGAVKNAITVGATNYPWKLDSAVLRRFTYLVPVALPTAADITEMVDIEFFKYFSPKSRMSYDKLMEMYGPGTRSDSKKQKSCIGGVPCEQSEKERWRNLPIVRRIKKNGGNISKIAEMAAKLQKNGYSGSDVSRMFGIAVRMMGEQALRDGRFVRIVDFMDPESAEDRALRRSIEQYEAPLRKNNWFLDVPTEQQLARALGSAGYKRLVRTALVPLMCIMDPFETIPPSSLGMVKTINVDPRAEENSYPVSYTIETRDYDAGSAEFRTYTRSDKHGGFYVPKPVSRIANMYVHDSRNDKYKSVKIGTDEQISNRHSEQNLASFIFDYVVVLEQLATEGSELPVTARSRLQVAKKIFYEEFWRRNQKIVEELDGINFNGEPPKNDQAGNWWESSPQMRSRSVSYIIRSCGNPEQSYETLLASPPFPGDTAELHFLFIVNDVDQGHRKGGLYSWAFDSESHIEDVVHETETGALGRANRTTFFGRIWEYFKDPTKGLGKKATVCVGTGIPSGWIAFNLAEASPLQDIIGTFKTTTDIYDPRAVEAALKEYFRYTPIEIPGIQREFAQPKITSTALAVAPEGNLCNVRLGENMEYMLASVDASAFDAAISQVRSTITPREKNDYKYYVEHGIPPPPPGPPR